MKNLKQWRAFKNLSAKELSELSGVSTSTIFYAELGQKNTQAKNKAKLAKAMDLQVTDIDWEVKTEKKFAENPVQREVLAKEQKLKRNDRLTRMHLSVKTANSLYKERGYLIALRNAMKRMAERSENPLIYDPKYYANVEKRIKDLENVLFIMFSL